jgi:hypothetical protein
LTTRGRQPWISGALALTLAGCAGAGSALQSVPAAALDDGSWMNPDVAGLSLLYISDEARNAVKVFTYPIGKAAGVLRQFHDPAGICSDKSGEVWVVNAPYHILRYAHGGKQPESTLEDPDALRFQGCSVDPASGDLAVTDAGRAGLAGSVVVFSGGKGTPHRFRSKDLSDVFFCAYDDKGNLFVDGLSASYRFHLVELPHGRNALRTIKVDQSVGFPGAVAWDGKYLALGDRSPQSGHSPEIYQISVSGTRGTVVGTTRLRDSCDLLGFTIPRLGSGKGHPQGTRVVAPDVCANAVRFYHYPGGGVPTKRLGGIQYPFGAAVSAAHKAFE